MGRIEKAKKNILYGYTGTLVSTLLKFISRSIFIYTIGVDYLGINGLYTNILSVLSFAELGIGTAMNFSLYKPVAENDVEKIKSLMNLYKNAYRWVAIIVTILGLSIVPFLGLLIKNPGSLNNSELVTYYLIFLFNTVTSYFVSYKYSLTNADQKNYIQMNIDTISSIIITFVQIIIIYLTHNYLAYLLVQSIIGVIQKFFISYYVNRSYPYLKERNLEKIEQDEKKIIQRNIAALILHKIGEIVVYQSDYLLISAFIGLSSVGYISNYNLIIGTIQTMVSVGFNSVISSLGNLIATENKNKRFETFSFYRFIGFIVYGISAIFLITLLNPFIEVWLGKQFVISQTLVVLMALDFYFKGERVVVNNYQTAAGLFYPGRYIPIIQGIVDFSISIFLVQKMGIAGIYIGTLIGGMIPQVIKPIIVYRNSFQINSSSYFYKSIYFMIISLIPIFTLFIVKKYILSTYSIVNFILLVFLTGIITLIVFYLAFRKDVYFQKIRKLIKR